MKNTAAGIVFLLSMASLSLGEPNPAASPGSQPSSASKPVAPRTACNSTPDPSFCRSILPPAGSRPLYAYGRLCLAKSLSSSRKFLSLVNRRLANRPALPSPTASALDDCGLLIGLNIDFLTAAGSALNYTSSPLAEAKADQIQTVLSALLTNVQTCLDGLMEAGKSNSATAGALAPLIINATKLYSVSLAFFTKAWLPSRKIKSRSSVHSPPSSPPNARRLLFHQVGMGGEGTLRLIEGRFGRRLLQSSTGSVQVNGVVTVSLDGTQNFTSIADAVGSAPNNTDGINGYYLIIVKAGLYEEYVAVPKNKRYVMMIGDGINQTVLTGNHSVDDGWTTFNSATFAVVGQGFVAINMTFRNTAGAAKHQAVAVRNGADLSTFYRCSFEGFQDTLYAHSMRQFYRECDVYGTVDYVFGNAAAVLQNCSMYSRLPMRGQQNTVTAQGRTDPNQNTGTSIQGGSFLAAPDLAADEGGPTKTYLGRPWKLYSRTVIASAFMGGLIQPAGWLPWDGDFALDTLYYAEYDNNGPGSSTGGRVKWAGYHILTNGTDALNFTVNNFIMGDNWLPETGVPFSGDLL